MRTPCATLIVSALIAAGGGAAAGGLACNQVDLDGSGLIDSGDLNLVLGGFGCAGFACAGDATGDGYTDSFDLNFVLSMFGDVCGPASCCEVSGVGGCDDPFCAEFVCMFDPSCCDQVWDISCVQFADAWCGCPNYGPCCMGEGGPCSSMFSNECLAMGGTPINAEDCQLVYCITPTPPCGQPGAGPCWLPHGTPGCDQAACCMEVCDIDPFCCDTAWDQICDDEGCQINCWACGCCAP